MTHRKLIIFEFSSIIFLFILGTFLHFTYQLSQNNLFVGLFSSVNESTWEHLKLFFFPMLVTSIIGYFLFYKDYPNYLCIKMRSTILGLVFIVVFFYTYTGVFGTNFTILDIGSFFAAGILSYYYSYKKLIDKTNNRVCCTKGAMLGFFILLICFLVFTFFPPKIGLFIDPITHTYGI